MKWWGYLFWVGGRENWLKMCPVCGEKTREAKFYGRCGECYSEWDCNGREYGISITGKHGKKWKEKWEYPPSGTLMVFAEVEV